MTQSETQIRFSDGAWKLDLELRGTIAFTGDLTDVESMSDGGYFKVREWRGLIPHTVEMQNVNGTITRKYSVGGAARPWDDEARRWLAQKLPEIVRRTGIGADARVKSILDKQGVSGVLDEIGRLGGDYARRLYFVALLDRAKLDASSVQPILAKAGETITSDYERRQVLKRITERVALDPRGADLYVSSVASMHSDYERRVALGALMATAGSAVQARTLLPALQAIESPYERRVVLLDVLKHASPTPDMKSAILTATATISSDYDRRQVLMAYVDAFGVDAAVREPFFAAVKQMQSDYERRQVLTALARKPGLSREVQEAAFDATSTMRSDYDRAESLLAFIHAGAVDGSSRQALVNAAQRFKSSYDQNRVLAALVKAESR